VNVYVKLIGAAASPNSLKILCRRTDYGVELPTTLVINEDPSDVATSLFSLITNLDKNWFLAVPKTFYHKSGEMFLTYYIALKGPEPPQGPFVWKTLEGIATEGMNEFDSNILHETLARI
jgi:hypothetical protein